MNNTLEILKEIISIPSYVDEKNNEEKLADYVVKFLKEKTKLNVVEQIVETGRRNIIAFSKPNPKLALFGHMDTVLPKVETENPFTPKEEDGKIYGLGAVDMKAGLAIMLNIAQTIQNPDLAFVFSVDEEYEFKGALKLREFKNFNPEVIINVEPTDNKILNGCRGITEFSFIVHGKSAHAGRKSFGINAIEKGVELVQKFQELISTKDSEESGKSTINLAFLHGGMQKINSDGSSEISGLGMVVPNYALLNCEIRVANTEISQKFIEENVSKIATEIGVSVTDMSFKFYLGSMYTAKSDLSQFEKAVKDSKKELIYGDISLAGYYEVQLLQSTWNSKCLVFGPGPINQSHTKDEYVTISSIIDAEKCITAYINSIVTANTH